MSDSTRTPPSALQLFDPGPQDGSLTPRQQTALDTVHDEPDGLSADEVGAVIHELKDGRWRHDRGERCEFCGKDGRQVLEALKARGLVRRNRHGIYRATHDVPSSASRPSGRSLTQSDWLPF